MSKPSGGGFKAVAFLGLVMLGIPLLVTGPSTATPRTVIDAGSAERPVALPLKARLLTGRIRRDRVTQETIDRTSRVRLPSASGGALRLLLTKSRYRLDVLAGDRLVKVYPVALGDPRGAKRRQGDHRTPEGDYTLIPHHPSPTYGACFYVCYPGPADAERGLRSGLVDPNGWLSILLSLRYGASPPYETALGGLILIHGTRDRERVGLTASNWTEGCVAMENADLEELLGVFSPRDRPVITIVR